MTLTPERIKELCDRHLRVVGAGYVRPQDAEAFARAIEAEVRKDALEEAAKVCDRGAEQMLHAYKREGAGRCAAAIRALKEAPPAPG